MKRLGIIDWGIGGISVYKRIKERIGDIPVVYFSDTGVTPYGKMSRAELVARLNAVIIFLKKKHDITHLVIGCNAASTAIDKLDDHDIPILGMIEPAVEQTVKLKPTRLGLIGGRRTVLSGVYRNAFAKRDIDVDQRIAQLLSALIESGDIGSEQLKNEARRIFAPIRNASHILLACTHYPAIASVLEKMVSPNTKLVDPTAELVRKVALWNLTSGGGEDKFLTSGDGAAMMRAARNAFDVDIPEPTKIKV